MTTDSDAYPSAVEGGLVRRAATSRRDVSSGGAIAPLVVEDR
jgi:hypothetical protein